MENEKIIILGPNNINQYKADLANLIISKNSDLSIMNTFITDDTMNKHQNINSSIDYIYYIPYTKVQEAYKNSSVLYCTIDELNNDITHGIMLDEYYNNDIMYLDFIDFNNISDSVFLEDNMHRMSEAQAEIKTSLDEAARLKLKCNVSEAQAELNNHIIIWLDTKINKNLNYTKKHEDIRESKYVYQRMERHNIPCLYFNIDNEHISDISNTILEYYNTIDYEKRQEIILENS